MSPAETVSALSRALDFEDLDFVSREWTVGRVEREFAIMRGSHGGADRDGYTLSSQSSKPDVAESTEVTQLVWNFDRDGILLDRTAQSFFYRNGRRTGRELTESNLPTDFGGFGSDSAEALEQFGLSADAAPGRLARLFGKKGAA